jgi:hypothetical protein
MGKRVGTEAEASFYDILTGWNERFMDSVGMFLLIGVLKVEEGGGDVSICQPRVGVDPVFLEKVGMETQARIYREFAVVLERMAVRCDEGLKPDILVN